MELIVADSAGNDLLSLADFELESESGWGDGVDNTFELAVGDMAVGLPQAAWRVYADGTELGGRVEGFSVDTSSREVRWTGSTWTGVLARRLLWPDAGRDYLTFSGDANALLRFVVSRLDLGSLFRVPAADAGRRVSMTASRDDPDALTNLVSALRASGMRMRALWSHGACGLSAEPVREWDRDSDMADFELSRSLLVTNHIKAAGKGELASREVVDLYADALGNVSGTKAMGGVFEVEEFLDASSSEGDQLRKQATDRLRRTQGDGSVEVDVRDGFDPGLGDVLVASCQSPGVTVRAEVSSRVTKATGAGMEVTYGATPAGVAMSARGR